MRLDSPRIPVSENETVLRSSHVPAAWHVRQLFVVYVRVDASEGDARRGNIARLSRVQFAISFPCWAMTVQKVKPRGTAAEEQQPSASDILSPSGEPHENDKEQSARNCYRGTGPQDSENLLGCVLAGE